MSDKEEISESTTLHAKPYTFNSLWRYQPLGLLFSVVAWKLADVSDMRTASTIKGMSQKRRPAQGTMSQKARGCHRRQWGSTKFDVLNWRNEEVFHRK